MSQLDTITATLKELIVRSLRLDDMRPDQIADDQPLLEGGLVVDSIDVLQLVLDIEKTFDVRLVTGTLDRGAWKSVATLAAAIELALQAGAAGRR
jgi:acyl carrier protein